MKNKKTIPRLLSYITYRKKEFTLGFILMVLSTITDLLGPIVTRHVIDDVITPAAASGHVWQKQLYLLITMFIGLSLMTGFMRQQSFRYRLDAANGISKIIRDELYGHIQKLPIDYFDHLPAGKIVARITDDTENIRQQFFANALGNVLMHTFYVIGAYIALAFFNKKLAVVMLLLLPLFYVWNKLYSKHFRRIKTKERELNAEITGQMNEVIQGMTIVQAFEQEDLFQKEFDETNQNWYLTNRRAIIMDSLFSFTLADLLRHLSILLLMVYLSTQYLEGVLGISVGTFYLLIDYMTRLYEPIRVIIQQMSFIQEAAATGERVFEVLDLPIEENNEQKIVISDGQIEFSNVTFGYHENQTVLKDINLLARPGETVAIVGHTGSGKSSIMNLLFRFYDPREGTIQIDDQEISQFSRQSVRSEMGIVLQDPYLFSGTVASNITMGSADLSVSDAEAALLEVGGADLLEQLAEGIETEVVDRGRSLSAGQRQLISFARALVFRPKILVLDEATSSVDTETEHMIQSALEVLKKGRTTFIIAHRLSTIQKADQILVLHEGQIIERGTHDELLTLTHGVYREMYQSQLK